MPPARLASIDLSLEPDTREHAAGGFAGILPTRNDGGAEWHLFTLYLFCWSKHSGRIMVQSDRPRLKTSESVTDGDTAVSYSLSAGTSVGSKLADSQA